MGLIKSVKQKLSDLEFKRRVRAYLVKAAEARNDPWRTREGLEKTVGKVLALDADLRDYVHAFVLDESQTTTSIRCEATSINELVASGAFTPINAALFIQWYRQDPKAALAGLLRRDQVVDLPSSQM